MNSSNSNNFLFKTKTLRPKEENKENPAFFCKVQCFKEDLQSPLIPQWLEQSAHLPSYTGVFSIDFVPAEDFECAQASIYRPLPEDYYKLQNRQWYDSALKEAYDQYKMFIYKPMPYQMPKIITPEDPYRVENTQNTQNTLNSVNNTSLMNLTYQKQSQSLIKNPPKGGFVSIDSFKSNTEIVLEDLGQTLSPEPKDAGKTSQGISAKKFAEVSSSDLIADQVLIHKSQKKNLEETLSRRLDELFPNLGLEFKTFIQNLLVSEKAELENLLVPKSIKIVDEEEKNGERFPSKEFLDKLSTILNRKYSEEEVISLLKQLFNLSDQSQGNNFMNKRSTVGSAESVESLEELSKHPDKVIKFQLQKKCGSDNPTDKYLFMNQQEVIPEQNEDVSSQAGEDDRETSGISNQMHSAYEKNVAPEFKPTIIDIMKPEDGAVNYEEFRKTPIFSSYDPSIQEDYYQTFDEAEEIFHSNYKKFTEDKRISELKQRYDQKHHKIIKQWINKMRSNLLPITSNISAKKPELRSKKFKKRVPRIHSRGRMNPVKVLKENAFSTRSIRGSAAEKSRNQSNLQKRTYTLIDTGRMLISEREIRSNMKTPVVSNETSNQIRESTPSAWSQDKRDDLISPKSTSTFKKVQFSKDCDINKASVVSNYYVSGPEAGVGIGSKTSRVKRMKHFTTKKKKGSSGTRKPKIPQKYLKYLDKLGGEEGRKGKREKDVKIWDPPMITALNKGPKKANSDFFENHVVEKNRNRFPRVKSPKPSLKSQNSARF